MKKRIFILNMLCVFYSCEESLLSNFEKKWLLLIILISFSNIMFAQIEFNGSYTTTEVNYASGYGINLGYQLPFKNQRMGVKPQIGRKWNLGYNNFTGTDFKNKTAEFHTTFFYKIGNKPNYKLIPNIGVNYRYNYWSAQMRPPLGTIPGRSYVTGIRGEDFVVSSTPGSDFTELEFFTPGFTFQLQNQFKVSDKISINATPFIEVDYSINDQEIGGGYIGLTYNR